MSPAAKYTTQLQAGLGLVRETAKLDDLETPENAPILKQLRALLSTLDALEQHEKDFKLSCKQQLEDLKGKIQRMQSEGNEEDEDSERIKQIEAQYEEDFQKLQRIRKLASKKKRVCFIKGEKKTRAGRADLLLGE